MAASLRTAARSNGIAAQRIGRAIERQIDPAAKQFFN